MWHSLWVTFTFLCWPWRKPGRNTGHAGEEWELAHGCRMLPGWVWAWCHCLDNAGCSSPTGPYRIPANPGGSSLEPHAKMKCIRNCQHPCRMPFCHGRSFSFFFLFSHNCLVKWFLGKEGWAGMQSPGNFTWRWEDGVNMCMHVHRSQHMGPESSFITSHLPLQKGVNPQIAHYGMLPYCITVCNYIIHIVASSFCSSG